LEIRLEQVDRIAELLVPLLDPGLQLLDEMTYFFVEKDTFPEVFLEQRQKRMVAGKRSKIEQFGGHRQIRGSITHDLRQLDHLMTHLDPRIPQRVQHCLDTFGDSFVTLQGNKAQIEIAADPQKSSPKPSNSPQQQRPR